MKCLTCQREFDPAQSDAMPFCGERCRLIDLGRWLGEEHSLPAELDHAADETPPQLPQESYD